MTTTSLSNQAPRLHAGSPAEYAAAYREMLAIGNSIGELNDANHAALSNGLISLEQFSAAAEVLAEHLLNQGGEKE